MSYNPPCQLLNYDKSLRIQRMMSFWNRFREHRESLGLSQKRVAEAIGWMQNTLSRAENSTSTPTKETLEKLASVPELGVTYERLRLWKTMDENPEVKAVVASIGEDEFLKIAAQKKGKQDAC